LLLQLEMQLEQAKSEMARFSFHQSNPWFEFAPAIGTAPRYSNQRQGEQPRPTTMNQNKL
jgi:hypothetical protein